MRWRFSRATYAPSVDSDRTSPLNFLLQLKDQMKKTSPEAAKTCRDEEKEWQEELDRLQTLVPHQASINRLKDTEIPALEKQIKEQAALLPALSDKAEAVSRFVCGYSCTVTYITNARRQRR